MLIKALRAGGLEVRRMQAADPKPVTGSWVGEPIQTVSSRNLTCQAPATEASAVKAR